MALALRCTPVTARANTGVVAHRTSRPAARRALAVTRATSEPEKAAPVVEAAAGEGAQGTPQPIPISEAKVQANIAPGFGDIMSFSGAPEIINGRLAMVGIMAALGAEFASNFSVAEQVTATGPATGLSVAFVFGLLSVASLVPLFKGQKPTRVGTWSPEAEMLNGRAAMIGFASLLVIEAVRGAALF